MAITRFALAPLQEWVKQPKRKPLIIRGARQIGKSTLVQLLAQVENLNLVTLNFERNPELGELFASNDPKSILQFLQLQTGQSIVPGRSILFLDEIQAAIRILPTLRYFYEELPDLHIIAAGSLLDVALVEVDFSMPVGRIEYFFLGPLSFEEYLLALHESTLLEFLNTYQLGHEYPLAIHQRLMSLLKSYCIIGGMPEAVAAFADVQDYVQSDRVKHAILNTYREDFAKYSNRQTPNKLREVFNAVPGLVGHKLKYSHINADERSTVIAQSLEKLCLARIIYLVKHSACNGIPLRAEVNNKIFKPLFLDVGLLCSSLGLNLLDLAKLQDITLINSGAIAEQFIGQHLLYSNPSYQEPQLYYWTREKKSSSAEIDYVVNSGAHIIPVEVKAGKTGTLRSLHYFLQEKSLHLGVKFDSRLPQLTTGHNLLANGKQIDYTLLALPLYFVGQLRRLLLNVKR